MNQEITLDNTTKTGLVLIALIVTMSMLIPHRSQTLSMEQQYKPSWATDFHVQLINAKHQFDSMDSRCRKEAQQIKAQKIKKVHPRDGSIYY